MNAKDALAQMLHSTKGLVNWFLGDLSDADLLTRPTPEANHIAWQLGHLIASEISMGKVLPGAGYPDLPAGFKERHTKETAVAEPPKGFLTKAEYLSLFNQVREATLSGLAALPEADLDKAVDGPLAKFAPTVGALVVLTANHTMMHGGQFSVVRRRLGKPVLF